jgi:hypothetical protein
MTYLIDLLAIVNGLALLLVLILLLRGPFRKFWIVLFYVSWELLATVSLTIFDVLYNGPAQVHNVAHADAVRWYARLYWGNDVIVDLFRFLLVIVLTYQATPAGVKRLSIGRVLGAVVVVAVGLPFLLFPTGPNPWPKAAWFNSTSELLNFGAAIMNLGLWAALLANRQRDRQFVAVSVGLGVVVTGTAISYGLRHFIAPEDRSIPDLFLMLVQLGAWTVWCRAFQPAPVRHLAQGNALQSP